MRGPFALGAERSVRVSVVARICDPGITRWVPRRSAVQGHRRATRLRRSAKRWHREAPRLRCARWRRSCVVRQWRNLARQRRCHAWRGRCQTLRLPAPSRQCALSPGENRDETAFSDLVVLQSNASTDYADFRGSFDLRVRCRTAFACFAASREPDRIWPATRRTVPVSMRVLRRTLPPVPRSASIHFVTSRDGLAAR